MQWPFKLSWLLLSTTNNNQSCNNETSGYQCNAPISHFWGQYSPYFQIPTDISGEVPPDCRLTFAQVLSRHGARYPLSDKALLYNALLDRLKQDVTSFPGKYGFLEHYNQTIDSELLTEFGQSQMFDSGKEFFERYQLLSEQSVPFIRAANGSRVINSALCWAKGYHESLLLSNTTEPAGRYPYSITLISEVAGSNNTLNHGLCKAFETEPNSLVARAAQLTFSNTFVPTLRKRVNEDLPGANLSDSDVILLMDLCPFSVVASKNGTWSPLCDLFGEAEWHSYNYYQTLGKYYGYGLGNSLGPTNGVGWTNELIARLTQRPVQDHTSVNHTLDDNKKTFPYGHKHTLYADFSHDNDMAAIFGALGLHNHTRMLSNTTIQEAEYTHGYSAAWIVPFSARLYVEKMLCPGAAEEFVRILVNGRVIPLVNCDVDELGRCTLSKFVESLSFARAGGHWNRCLV